MYKMEYEENAANLTTRAARKKLNNIDYGTKSLQQITKSVMLDNVPNQSDTICNVEMDVDNLENELKNEILRPDDAKALQLEDMMNNILEYLDETISILQVVDIGSTESREVDYSCYEYQNHVENVNDDITVTENHENDSNSDIEAEINDLNVTVTKNHDKNCNEWSEFFEAFMIVLMFFSLYFLSSCVI